MSDLLFITPLITNQLAERHTPQDPREARLQPRENTRGRARTHFGHRRPRHCGYALLFGRRDSSPHRGSSINLLVYECSPPEEICATFTVMIICYHHAPLPLPHFRMLHCHADVRAAITGLVMTRISGDGLEVHCLFLSGGALLTLCAPCC